MLRDDLADSDTSEGGGSFYTGWTATRTGPRDDAAEIYERFEGEDVRIDSKAICAQWHWRTAEEQSEFL